MASKGIMTSRAGTIIRVPANSGGGSAAVISVDGLKNISAIILGMNVRLETDASYMRSLSDNFYVFPFGDKPSDVVLDLLIITDMSSVCRITNTSGANSDTPLDFTKGLEDITSFYKANRVQNSNITLLKIAIGGSALVLNGLLTNMSLVGSVDSGAPSVRASLSMKAWPTT